jgi:hypothetical protein
MKIKIMQSVSGLATKININKTLKICSAFNNGQTTDYMASFTLVLEDSVNKVALELATLKANIVNTLPYDIVIGRPTMAIEKLYHHFRDHLQPKRKRGGEVESGHCDCLTVASE